MRLDHWSGELSFLPDIGLRVSVFANGPGDLGSIPGRVIPKTQKMVLDASLLNTQHYKVRIKGKVEQSREGVAPFLTHWCSSYRKGSLRVTLDYGRQLYLPLWRRLSISGFDLRRWMEILKHHKMRCAWRWSQHSMNCFSPRVAMDRSQEIDKPVRTWNDRVACVCIRIVLRMYIILLWLISLWLWYTTLTKKSNRYL